VDQHHGQRDRCERVEPLDLVDEQHRGHDRTGTGHHRGPERDQRHVGVATRSCGDRLLLAGEQLERDQQQKQASRRLQGR
jgi:hypothetical protein